MISILTLNDDACLVESKNSTEIAACWEKKLSVDVGVDFKQLGTIEFYKCNVTGFRWYSPPEAAGDASLYGQLEKFDWYYMQEKWEFTQALNLLAGVTSVLEVGVGEGNFLVKARRAGFKVEGVELNPKGASRARTLGFEIHELLLNELSNQKTSRFDAICSFQVLEHVPDPLNFLQGMISMLRPGGKLIVSVPNAEVMRKIDPQNREILNQPPHHMGHWDEAVFRSLEKLLPLRVISVHKEPLASYHIAWFVNAYLRNRLSFLGVKLPRFIVNRYSTLPLQWLMRAGLHKLFHGHTLLVEFEYKHS